MSAEHFIGTAGWTVPRLQAERFPAEGSTLERYASRLNAAEINSSFYRPHKPATYERWAASVPDHFRFSLKLPKTITHEKRLVDCEAELAAFANESAALGTKRAVILVQLPPKLAFDAEVADAFFPALRSALDAGIACEPRHASWFEPEADELLARHHVARVAADPAKVPQAAEPGGWRGLTYYRLHGSPHIYRSVYETERIAELAAALPPGGWCIFDNTMSYGAAANALDLSESLAARSGRDR